MPEHIGDIGICPDYVLEDTLNLLQSRGAYYAHQIGLFRPCLESFRRACRIIIYCCHFSLRFSPFRSTYNTHVGKSSVSYSYTAQQYCCSGESAKEISFLSFNGFGEHMEWASISFRSIRHFRTLHSATL